MNINEINLLNERTLTQMSVLGDFADAIISAMPNNLPVGMKVRFEFGTISGKLAKKYEADPFISSVLKYISYIPVGVYNEKDGGSSVAGWVGSTDHNIQNVGFNIAALVDEERDWTKAELLKFRSPSAAIKEFRAVVIHEIRHVFQFFKYKDFYKKSSDDNYSTSPTEIDAAWVHNLSDHKTSDYPSAASYVDVVMSSFSNYKSLTAKQLRHYRAKTATYWAENHLNKQDRLVNRDLKAEALAKREELLKTIANSMAITDTIDLRQSVPNYSSDTFMLPVAVQNGARAIILSGKENQNKANAPVVYLIAALTMDEKHFKAAVRVLTRLIKFTPEDVYANMGTFAKFDQTAIEAYIRERLSED